MRTPSPLHIPDPVTVLASLCEWSMTSPSVLPTPTIAAAVGTHPIAWHRLDRQRLEPPPGTYAIGVIGGGTLPSGEDVVAAFSVDVTDRRRAVIWRSGSVFDTAEPTGELVSECRAALGLLRAA